MENNYTAYEIVEDIKKLREAFQLTQQTLAEKAAVSAHTVQNWEYGKYPPKKQHIKNIIKSLKLHERDYPELFAYAEVTEETIVSENEGKTAVPETANEITTDETLSEEAKSLIPQADVAISEVSNEKKRKSRLAVIGEKLKELRKPFFIGVGVWGAALVIIAIICGINYAVAEEPMVKENNNLYYYKRFIETDWTKLFPCIALSLLAIIAISILIHIIIRKVRKK